MPASCGETQNTDMDWKYRTEPNKNNSYALNNNISFWPAGKILGGSSCMN